MTANQKYKSSGSNLPFKKWLKLEQMKGNLENREPMLYADGTQEKSLTTKEFKKTDMMNNLVGLLGISLLVYGLSKSNN